MYTILRNNRRATKVTFPSYESARQFLRRMFRRKLGPEAYLAEAYKNAGSWSEVPMWDNISRNPTGYTALGYKIRKVANA